MLSLGYIFKASRDSEIGEEFFTDCNRSLFCGKCKDKVDFYDQSTKNSKKCNLCGGVW